MQSASVNGTTWRVIVRRVIYEADSTAGKAFDVGLLLLITVSVTLVMLESVDAVGRAHGLLLRKLEWVITALFTVEYGLRLACVERPAVTTRVCPTCLSEGHAPRARHCRDCGAHLDALEEA